MDFLRSKKGTMAGETAGLIIGLLMVVIVIAVTISSLQDSITLTGTGNDTFNLIVSLGWVALTILAVGVIAVVGKWIISIFQ